LKKKKEAKYRHPNFNANRVPVGGKPVNSSEAGKSGVRTYNNNNNNKNTGQPRQIVGGVAKNQGPGTQTAAPKNPAKKKPKKPAQSNATVVEEIEMPTF